MRLWWQWSKPIAGSTIGQLVNGQYYIAGGGGGADDWSKNPGGIGGGGTNADLSVVGTAALPNTGSGGGGGGSRQWYGTDGASGVVIIRYQA